MQHHNDISTMQDTSTQAMTEVALGLSMAFFALLIIALMSVALPSQIQANSVSKLNETSANIDLSNQIELSLQETTQNKQSDNRQKSNKADASEQQQTILLFWGGQFFNTQQQLVSISEIRLSNDLVVAVSPQIPFNQLIDIQKQFVDKQMRLTTLSQEWQNALAEGVMGAP
ncbi:MAG: hypothetical protein ACJAVV_000626 [Alphaproteobacteria bacterium]|jgi:hypothetical protein